MYAKQLVLKVKIVRYTMRVTGIQGKFRAYHANRISRFQILQDCY
jgi:hypothetical protein